LHQLLFIHGLPCFYWILKEKTVSDTEDGCIEKVLGFTNRFTLHVNQSANTVFRVGECERLHKVVSCYVHLLYVEIGLTITPRTNEVVLSLSNLV